MSKLWKPSNSADGMYMECICATCERDKKFRDGEADSCPIAANMYAIGPQPEWTIGPDGAPTCSAFLAEGEQERCPATIDMFASR